ncbi:MAG: hypothetical protein IJB79_07270 [Candidatus Gastranaerophilales bacterium]|nr:hypothetical protein [Candidatus Gastranaerophilales bacterium]
MRLLITFLTFILFSQISFASEAEFGQYRYSQYLGIQQQLQNQRANAIRRQRMYNQNPTRNIQYPSMNNPYPNIQRSYAARITPRQRYSAQYYRSL